MPKGAGLFPQLRREILISKSFTGENLIVDLLEEGRTLLESLILHLVYSNLIILSELLLNGLDDFVLPRACLDQSQELGPRYIERVGVPREGSSTFLPQSKRVGEEILGQLLAVDEPQAQHAFDDIGNGEGLGVQVGLVLQPQIKQLRCDRGCVPQFNLINLLIDVDTLLLSSINGVGDTLRSGLGVRLFMGLIGSSGMNFPFVNSHFFRALISN